MIAGSKTIALAVIGLVGVVAAPPIGPPTYLDFATFKALTTLAPEVQQPRMLTGLTEIGHVLWAQGRLRMPAAGHFAQGDFARTGEVNAALLFEGGRRRYLLIAGHSRGQWVRKALLELQEESAVTWDGTVLRLGLPESFVEWSGTQFHLARGPLAHYAYSYGVDEFAGVLFKLTYIGAQTEPIPGVLVSSYYRYYRRADLDAFKPFRRPDVHYANDDLGFLWHVTMTPQQLRALVLTAKNMEGIDQAAARTGQEMVSHSLSIVDLWSAHRPNAFEALLTQDEAASLLHAAARAIEGENPAAARLFREYLTLFGK